RHHCTVRSAADRTTYEPVGSEVQPPPGRVALCTAQSGGARPTTGPAAPTAAAGSSAIANGCTGSIVGTTTPGAGRRNVAASASGLAPAGPTGHTMTA